jgi:hypothetical protein
MPLIFIPNCGKFQIHSKDEKPVPERGGGTLRQRP